MGIASHTFICPHFRIHLPNTAHLSCNSANIGCNLYNIVSDLSIYRLFLQKSAVLLDKKVNSRIMVIHDLKSKGDIDYGKSMEF